MRARFRGGGLALLAIFAPRARIARARLVLRWGARAPRHLRAAGSNSSSALGLGEQGSKKNGLEEHDDVKCYDYSLMRAVKLFKITDEQFANLVKQYKTKKDLFGFIQMLRMCGLHSVGGSRFSPSLRHGLVLLVRARFRGGRLALASRNGQRKAECLICRTAMIRY